MSAELLHRTMGLFGYEVKDEWMGKNGCLFIELSMSRDDVECRSCGCRRVHLHDSRFRSWQGTPIGLTRVIVMMKVRRVKCLSCGSKTWHQVSFAEGQRQITKEFERHLEFWLSRVTIQDIVNTYGISWNTVSAIDIRRLKKLSQPSLGRLKRLAIDENYLGKKHKFITVVLDLDTRAIVSVTQGRGQNALKGFFSKLEQSGAKVRAVATDMAGGYIAAVRKYLPKAKLVFDRFHVMKLMNDKLTILRRDLYRELKGGLERDVLKGIRWLLLKSPENLTKNETVDEQKQLTEALRLNEPLFKAYYLKEQLGQFWNQPSKAAAKSFLKSWCRRAENTGIRVLQTMSKTLQTHATGLLNWYDERISTGPLEGINNKIGALQRRAYGYRNYEHFKLRLLTMHHAKLIIAG